MEELLRIQGIGPVLAEKLLKQGIDSRDKLIKSDIYDSLSTLTKADLKYNPMPRIKREYISKVEKMLKSHIKSKFTICGSYRRNQPDSGDIDIVFLVSKSVLKKGNFWNLFSDKVKDNGVVEYYEPFAIGEKKIMTYGRIIELDKNVQFDFFLSPKEEWPYYLVYVTGSQLFNIRMRAVAKRRGLLLNEHGMCSRNNPKKCIKAKNERDVFDILGMKWLTPEERNI